MSGRECSLGDPGCCLGRMGAWLWLWLAPEKEADGDAYCDEWVCVALGLMPLATERPRLGLGDRPRRACVPWCEVAAALALSGLGEREIIPLAMLGLPMLRSTVSSVRSILRRLRVRISCFLDTRRKEGCQR